MTPISIAYFVLGLVALFWPLVTLFFKRRVLDAQWLMVAALAMVGISIIIYSTFFNSFLKGEYMLVLLYMFLSLIAVPMTQVAVTSLTRPQGVSRVSRLLAIPSFAVIVAMFLSIFIGTPEMYRLWIERGADGIAGRFFDGSWRYNLIVVVHYYLYWFVIVGELLFLTVYSVVAIHRFRHVLDEYFTEEFADRRTLSLSYVAIAVNCLAIVLSYIVYPFNRPRPLWVVVVFCVVEAAAMFAMGWLVYHISHSAESMRHANVRTGFGNRPVPALAREVAAYVERDRHFLDPDISVFLLADRLRMSQDDVVDAVHHLHGTTFSVYIDSLRIEYAASLLAAVRRTVFDDPEAMTRIAHRCGYLNEEAFLQAFERVMKMSVVRWCSGN